MKVPILNKTGKEKGLIDMPKNFSAKIRTDILAKVFEAQKIKQSTGAKIGAGAAYSASGILKHRRHVWKTTYGRGISRVPRKIMSRSGSSFNWVGATVASTRGGRRAHPPRSEENQIKKINKKELRIAFDSALAGTINSSCLEKKYGRKITGGFVFDSSILDLKTKDFIKVLKKVFSGSHDKIWKKKKIRAGKGKLRGRKYKSNAGLLFVIGSDEKMKKKGISIVPVEELEIKDLAPNGEPGRLTCYTEKAVSEIGGKFK